MSISVAARHPQITHTMAAAAPHNRLVDLR
jgi:hypothetical protein